MTAMNLEQARFNMIEQQIRTWDVLDDNVLKILSATPREAFVPEKYRGLAFTDINIPLGHEQVMMAPKLEARLLQALDLKVSDSILEIGTGSGYLAACLARLGGSVHSVDLYDDFLEAADARLKSQQIGKVTLEQADAASGWAADGRFDAIAVTGSLPMLHTGYHNALAIGGRLFVIVGTPPIMQALLITRVGEQEWNQESLFETSLPALVNAPRPQTFQF
jgi:protein-L-isoaspartate(D-aspartate) O-methyltransferase